MSRGIVVVDVQNDFCEGGSLAVEGGAEVARRVSAHLGEVAYAVVVATRDQHLPDSLNGGHFAALGEEPDYALTWPVHCVVGTPGADYHPELDTARLEVHVRKGMGLPAYSGFDGVATQGEAEGSLGGLLRARRVTALDVVGLATDYCVRQTALDAARLGFEVRVLPDLVAAVAPASGEAALREVRSAGVRLG